jgi:hypothetical protein
VLGLSGSHIVVLQAKRLLQPLNHDYLPNLQKNIWPSLQSPFYDVGSRYTVPYVVWADGIGWRNDKIGKDIGSMKVPWDIFWESQAYSGKVALLSEDRETIAMALHKSNVYVDISGWKAKYLPASFLREAKGRLRNQVCFGSDYPMFDPQEHLSDVQSLDLGAEVNDGLLRRNARRFLGLPDGDDAEAGGLSRSPRE